MFDLVTDTDAAVEPATLEELRAAAIAVGKLVRRIDPDSVPLSQASSYWKASDAITRFGQAATTLLARRVDESRAWKDAGCKSPDEWRAREGGTGLGDARRQGKASEQLRDLPDTTDALRKGELSAGQAEAISDAATVNPHAEQDLLDAASRRGWAICRLTAAEPANKATATPTAPASGSAANGGSGSSPRPTGRPASEATGRSTKPPSSTPRCSPSSTGCIGNTAATPTKRNARPTCGTPSSSSPAAASTNPPPNPA
jgi:hypothetical protein